MAKTQVEKDAIAKVKADAKASEDAKKADKNSVTVSHQGGERVFSKDVHGEDFEDTAKEFAETNGGTIL